MTATIIYIKPLNSTDRKKICFFINLTTYKKKGKCVFLLYVNDAR